MSRVFAKPVYYGTAISRLLACCDDGNNMHSETAIAGAVGVPLEVLSDTLRASGDIDAAREVEQMHLIGERAGLDRMRDLRRVGHQVVLPLLRSAKKIEHGFDAQCKILLKYLGGKLKVDAKLHTNYINCAEPAKESATIGLVGSLCSPQLTAKKVKSLPTYSDALSLSPEAMSAFAAADPWRYGVSNAKASDALRDALRGEYIIDANDFSITGHTFQMAAPGATGVVFMDISVVKFEDEETLYVLDRDERGHLAEILYTCGMFCMYGLNWRKASGGSDARVQMLQTLHYVRDSLLTRIGSGNRIDTLAKQMKSSYAILLAKFGAKDMDPEEEALLKQQLPELEKEVSSLCEGEGPWYKVVERWPQELQLDMGTGWNFLPPPQIVPELLSNTMKRKVNEPRPRNMAAKKDFLTYCATVMTAHVLVHIGDMEVTWENVPVRDGRPVDMEEEEWVKACRRGNLSYPSSFSGVRIQGVLPWRDHISNWHFTSKDVTHVHADARKYETRDAYEELKDEDNNELIYSLKYGSLLSKKYSAATIRTMFMEGKLPGDRIELIAGKAENTKPAVPLEGKDSSGTRETASGDDIGRESFTEIDRNLGLISRILHGVSSRTGRSGLEGLVAGILNNMASNGCIMSLDVVGWSPKMWRELEMDFVDLLISFFVVPETLRVSSFLKDVKVVMSKSGFHEMWDMKDGSIQGFFPTGDSIMHSLVAQWAMNRAKRKGKIPKKAKIAKATLIDDILLTLSHVAGKAKQALEAMCDEYLELGFEPDLIKTLMSKMKGHFLNRLYYKGNEVLTPCKIFSKSDRDHERKLATIHDKVNAVFGSMWGALDRGADPIWSYYVAHWRALTLIAQAGGKKWQPTSDYTTVGCWLSPGLGGFGIPSFAHWASRDSTTSMGSGLGVISTLMRTVEQSDKQLHTTLKNVMYSISVTKVQPKSYVAFLDDPFSVTLDGVVDPSVPGHRVMRKAQEKAIKDASFRMMLERANSAEYEAAVEAFLKSAAYPAPAVAELSACLPHAVIRSLTIKAERNEALLKLVSYKDRRLAINKIKKLNGSFVRSLGSHFEDTKCPDGIIPDSSFVLLALDSSLQSVMGVNLAMTVRPPVCDIVAKQDDPDNSLIQVSLPQVQTGELFEGTSHGGIRRSTKSKSLVLFKHDDDASWDPLSRAYASAMNAMCMLDVLGYNAEFASRLFAQFWAGVARCPYPSIPKMSGANPARICGRTSRMVHTCAAFPNISNQVRVPASKFIRRFEESRISVDPLAMVYVMKACALADRAICEGDSGEPVRGYSLRTVRGVIYPQLETKVDMSAVNLVDKVQPALSGMEADRMATLMTTVAEEARVDDQDYLEQGLGIDPSTVAPVTAMEILRRIPPGEVTNILVRAQASGAGHASIVGKPSADVTATSAQARAIGRTMRDINDASTGHSMVRIANALAVVAADKKKRVSVFNKLLSNDGDVLRSLRLSRFAEVIRSEDASDDSVDHAIREMSVAAIKDGKGLGKDPVGFWEGFIVKHRDKSVDSSVPVAIRVRSAALNGGMSAWPQCYSRVIPASHIWVATLIEAVRKVSELHVSLGMAAVPHSVYNQIKAQAGSWSLSRNGGTAQLSKAIYSPMRDAGEIVGKMPKKFLDALNNLWTYFKSDILIPLSQREVQAVDPRKAMDQEEGEDEDKVQFVDVTSHHVVDVKMGQGSAPNDAQWQEFCDSYGYTDISYGEDEDIDEEFADWRAQQRGSDADVV